MTKDTLPPVDGATHAARVKELLEYNNTEVERRRAAEGLIRKVKAALGFVPPEKVDGMRISYDAYENLGGDIIDIEAGQCDATDLRTLKRVEKQLSDAREFLGGT